MVFAAGIACGLTRLPSARLETLLLPAVLLALAASTLAAAGRLRTGTHGLLALMLAAGCATGTARLAQARASCAAHLPAETRLRVQGTVLQGGPAPRVRITAVESGGRTTPCTMEVGARWDAARLGSPPASAAGFGAIARLWRAPGAGALGGGALLLVDSAWSGPSSRPAPLRRMLGAMREGARSRVDALYPRRAGLVASLLLAQRDALDTEVRERFARAGLSHLLAISGLHVGLIAGVLLLLAGAARLPRRVGPPAAAAGTVAYVAFLGAPAAATRAAVQIVLLLSGRALQRPAQAASLIATAALVLLACDPASALAPGFQLSFAGVGGILFLRRPLLTRIRAAVGRATGGGSRTGRRAASAIRWGTDGIATSLSATLATAPVAAWHFGRVAPVGVLANLAAIPLVGAIIPTLALSLLLALLWPAAGTFVAGAGNALLALLDRVATFAAAVPGGAFTVSGPGVLLLACAVLAGYLVSRRLGRLRPVSRLAAWGAISAVVLLLGPVRPASGRVEIHMIDVGQGDAFALRSPAGRWVLVDAGPASNGYDAGERVVVPYLRRHGARRLEALVLTHPDGDHTGGSAAVVRALRPRWVGDPGVPAGKGLYVDVLRVTAEAGVPWVGLSRGVTLDIDGVTIEIVHPATVSPRVDDVNAACVVMRVSYGAFSALLTGDAPLAVEDEIVLRYGDRLQATVLKVGHHGSATSTGEALLAALHPRVALVSVGRHNHYGHPAGSVLRRLQQHGIRIFRTDEDGAVVISADRNGRLDLRREREIGR